MGIEQCSCGRTHKSETNSIIVKEGALESIPSALREAGCANVLLVADAHTIETAKDIRSMLPEPTREFIYEDKPLVPNESAVERLINALLPETDLLLSLGSGTISDLCRYVAFKMDIPYIVIATAPSMDGYLSNVSPLLINGLKNTVEAKPPLAFIGDLDILSNAPVEMIAAGFGDIIGKYTCLNDWELSSVINEEYWCETIVKMELSSIDKCAACAGRLPEKEAIRSLTDALLLSGTAMSYAGNSRPASGAEHHLSHFWEMSALLDGRTPALHGAKVGFAALVIIKLIEMLKNEEIDWDTAYQKALSPNTEYSSKLENVYRRAAPEIIAESEKSGVCRPESILKRLEVYRANWERIMSVIDKNIPALEEVKGLLLRAGCPVTPKELGINREEFEKGIVYAMEIRSRYTVLRMLADLGLLSGYAVALTEHYF